MRPAPHAVVTCSRCGESFVDVDVESWVNAGRSVDDFGEMVQTLGRAHTDTCDPRAARRARRTPADRRRRRWWWLAKAAVPINCLTFAIVAFARGEYGSGIVLTGAWLSYLLLTSELLTVYRSGYLRGRATADEPRAIDLHPADRSWNPFEHREHHRDQGGTE